MKRAIGSIAAVALLILVIGCAPGNLSTREKSSGVNAAGGATTGGVPGSAVGQSGAAVIGGSLGLATGVLVGDQPQGQESRQPDQQRQIDGNKTGIQRQRTDMEKLRRQGEY